MDERRERRGRRGPPIVRAVSGVLVLACITSCTSQPDDRTPEGALALFLDAMAQSEWNPRANEQAYRLLAAPARDELAQRAQTSAMLAGRDYEPWEMLPPGRFRLRFSPRQPGGLRARVQGDRATVLVLGVDPDQRAEVPMRLEQGRWRVALEIPALRGAFPAEPAAVDPAAAPPEPLPE